MAVYFVTGKLGAGKTLCAVGRIRDYLETGRQVATNLDLKLENMLPDTSKQSAIRLPDKPRLSDLKMLGRGCVEENEDKYGLIVLDELGTWFNSRNWRDPERLALIDWCLHARKHHWDIFFIVQSIDSLDGQLVNALCEHLVVCKRTDRLSIPIVGGLFRFMGFDKTMPKIHVANVLYGQTESAPRVRRWVYRGKDLYNSYNTAQVFTDQNELIEGELTDFRAPYSFLSSFHVNAVQYRKQLQTKIDDLNPLKPRATLPALGGVFKGSSLSPAPVLITVMIVFAMLYYFNVPGVPPVELIKTAQAETSQDELDKSIISIAYHKDTFVSRLLNEYRPRLAALMSKSSTGEKYALIQFYKGNNMVEQLDIDALHSLGVGVIVTKYGVDLITANETFPVTAWAVARNNHNKESVNQVTSN